MIVPQRTSTLVVAGLLAFALAWAVPGRAAPPAGNGPVGKQLIAVLDLEGAGTTDAEREAITDRLREVLLKTGRFILVNRDQMKAVLNEQALQQTGCTSQDCAVQVGQILGVRRIVAGKVVKLGPDAWQVSAIMINVETAETVRADSVRFQGGILALLDRQIPVLGAELAAVQRPAAASASLSAPVVSTPASAAPALEHLAGQWSTAARLQVGRSGHASVVLDGRVYVIGGADSRNQALDSVEVLASPGQGWQDGPPLPSPRSDAAAAVLGGRIYVLGGRNASMTLNRVDVLNPASGTWSAGVPLPAPCKGALAAVLDGRLYLAGGIGEDGHSLQRVLMLAPGASQWQPVASMQVARGYATGQVVEGRLYVVGGRRVTGGVALLGPGELLRTVEVYDAAGDRWSDAPGMPRSLFAASSVLVGRALYVFGGVGGTEAMQRPQGSYWRFSLIDRLWSEAGKLPGKPAGGIMGLLGEPAGRAGLTAVALPDRVLLIGGRPSSWQTVSVLR